MANKTETETAAPYVVECHLKKWPGKFTLPDPDEFSGADWQAWRKAVSDTDFDAVNQLYGYAGLRLIDAVGKWEFAALPLKTVQKWEKNPADERIKFISWVGREVRFYVDRHLLDPTV